jgi:hypothetical protein
MWDTTLTRTLTTIEKGELNRLINIQILSHT